MPSDLDDQIIALFATLSDNEKREFIRLFSAAVEEQASQTSSQDLTYSSCLTCFRRVLTFESAEMYYVFDEQIFVHNAQFPFNVRQEINCAKPRYSVITAQLP